ncbi:MAG TPA: phage holin family protein [Ardenticatenaceae bacterium]|nr:phage holin family protein [Ardenticatenaceae bacterium]
MQTRRDDRSLGELFAELSRETSNLVREEVALAKSEVRKTATEAGKDVGFMAAGGFVAYAGFLAIIAAIILVLGEFLPLWIAALLVGLVVAGIGYFLVQRGLSGFKNLQVAPQQTIETLKEDKEWIQEQMR